MSSACCGWSDSSTFDASHAGPSGPSQSLTPLRLHGYRAIESLHGSKSRLSQLQRALADVIADVRRRVEAVDQSPRDVMEAAIGPVSVAALVADHAGQFVAANAA